MARILGLLFPGSWQILQRRYGKGLVIFCLYTLFLNAYFMSPLFLPNNLNALKYGFIILAAVVWLTSCLPMFVPSGEARPPPIPEVPDDPQEAEE